MKSCLIVVTSCQKYPTTNLATGLWFSQASHFYQVLLKQGFKIDFASPRGGYVPIDPLSLNHMQQNEWKWYSDSEFRKHLGQSKKLADVKSQDYNVIYFAGGHGVVWDFLEDQNIKRLGRQIYQSGGIVSSVCHGAVALLNITLSNGKYLIQGKKLTAFSDEEEKQVGKDKYVPYLTQTQLRKRGSIYQKKENWKSYAVLDGKLVTGQNPGSSHEVAQGVLKTLKMK